MALVRQTSFWRNGVRGCCIRSLTAVQIALPLKPHRVEAKTSGWRLDGLHEDGEADDDLQLSRVEGNEADTPSGLQAGTLPPFVRIEREIQNRMDSEINSTEIGELVLKELRDIDEVAYVRFASVYKAFRDIAQFRDTVVNLMKKD